MEEIIMGRCLLNIFFLLISYSIVTISTVSAESSNWKSPSYNFGNVKRILLLEPTFSYTLKGDSNDKFDKYPYGQEKFINSLNNRVKNLGKYYILNLDYIDIQIQGDPSAPTIEDKKSLEFTTLREQELPKYVDLVLSAEVRNYGWYYEYYDAYDSTETIKERVEYGGINADGKKYSGWMEIPKEVVVHHPAGHQIYDDANVILSLTDPKTKQVVWSYTDSRYRSSFSWSGNRDNTGPESMMNRILDAAFTKIPLAIPK